MSPELPDDGALSTKREGAIAPADVAAFINAHGIDPQAPCPAR